MSSESNSSYLRRLWLGMTNFALGSAGVACLWLGVVALWVGSDLSAAATGLTAGLVLLLAASIERFEVLKGLGMEARTRTLDEKISQATATLDQLRELAELSCDVVIAMTSKVGRWDSAPRAEESYETVQRVRKHLVSLGSSGDVVSKTMAPWVLVTTRDLVRKLIVEISRQLELGVQHYDLQLRTYPMPVEAGDQKYQAILDARNKFINFRSQQLGSIYEWHIGTHAAQLRSIVESMPLLDEAVRQELQTRIAPWLPRLDYLAANYELSDKEQWFTMLKNESDRISSLIPG